MSTAAQAMSRAALEDKLFAAKLSLLKHADYLRWSGVLMMGSTYLVDSIPTAMTDGRNEWYGTEFVRELGVRELRFVILHENLHKMARHLIVWEDLHKEDPELANQACDHWINLTLHDLDPGEKFIAHPRRDGERMGCYDPRFRGMDTKQIFDMLKQEKQDQDQEGKEGKAGFDTHDWEGASKLTDKEKEQLSKDVDRAMRQGAAAAHRAGVGSDGSSRLFGQLLAPKVDWREQLRQFVSANTRAKDVSSWRKVNRRLVSEGIYLPSLIGERVRCVVGGVDTSGSTSRELTAFLSEVTGIAEGVRPEKLHLMYWDSRVVGHEVYGAGGSSLSDLRLSTKPAGGGGTDPRCVIEAIEAMSPRPDCVVMLTDGYITDWGVWPSGVPLLWVICGSGGRNIMAPVGQTIHMDN